MNDVDPLTERALRARASLQEASDMRPVPAFEPQSRRTVRAFPSWAVPAMAAVAVASLVVGVLWSNIDNPRRVVTPGAVTSVQIGQLPVAVATDGRLIWVADAGSDEVIAVDAHTLRRQWAMRISGRPVALAHGLGALWVVEADSKRLLKLDPRTGRTLQVAGTSLDPVAVDVAFGAVWVLSAGNHTLDRYDANSVAQTGSALLQAAGRGLAHSRDALWVAAPGAHCCASRRPVPRRCRYAAWQCREIHRSSSPPTRPSG